jgi:glycosyltransferase involved in cell wall biosynthesis
VVDPFLPLHDVAAGSLRLLRILEHLTATGWQVTYIARNGRGADRYRPPLEAMGVEVFATDPERLVPLGIRADARPIDLRRILTERQYEVAWLSFYDVAEQYLPEIRRHSPSTRVLVDTVDVHFVREGRQALLSRDGEAARRALLTRERELSIYARADRVVTVTRADAESLREHGLETPISVVPTVHPVAGLTPSFEARSGLLFVGNFHHTPNVDAATWLAREILPELHRLVPGVPLPIVGPNPPEAVTALAGPTVRVTGWVPETAPFLDAALVSVAPLRFGAGIKGKIGEALARGLPVVTSPLGAEGMELVDGENALIAGDTAGLARAVARLVSDRALWERLAEAGRRHVEARYAPEAVGRAIHAALAATMAPAPGASRVPEPSGLPAPRRRPDAASMRP